MPFIGFQFKKVTPSSRVGSTFNPSYHRRLDVRKNTAAHAMASNCKKMLHAINYSLEALKSIDVQWLDGDNPTVLSQTTGSYGSTFAPGTMVKDLLSKNLAVVIRTTSFVVLSGSIQTNSGWLDAVQTHETLHVATKLGNVALADRVLKAWNQAMGTDFRRHFSYREASGFITDPLKMKCDPTSGLLRAITPGFVKHAEHSSVQWKAR